MTRRIAILNVLLGAAVTVACAPPGAVRVYDADGVLLGIGTARGLSVQPERLLHADHPRPAVLPA